MILESDFFEILKKIIEKENYYFFEGRSILLTYKNDGGSKANALKILNRLRETYKENEIFDPVVPEVLPGQRNGRDSHNAECGIRNSE